MFNINNGKQSEQLFKVVGGHSASLTEQVKCRGLSEQPKYTRMATKLCNMKLVIGITLISVNHNSSTALTLRKHCNSGPCIVILGPGPRITMLP